MSVVTETNKPTVKELRGLSNYGCCMKVALMKWRNILYSMHLLENACMV